MQDSSVDLYSRVAVLETKVEDCRSIGDTLIECVSRLAEVETRDQATQASLDKINGSVQSLTDTLAKHKPVVAIIVWLGGASVGAAITAVIIKLVG